MHLHTGPGERDLTVSLYLVRTDIPVPAVLVHRHRTLGLLLPPGGHVEWTESVTDALTHELVEETGYDPGDVTLLQPPERVRAMDGNADLQPLPFTVAEHRIGDLDHVHLDLAYAAVVPRPPAAPPAAGESTELTWVARPELAGAGLADGVAERAAFAVDVCLPRWDRIPLSGGQPA